MARMTAAEAAVHIMEKEGAHCAFGVPGAAINPLYAAFAPPQPDQACAGTPCRRPPPTWRKAIPAPKPGNIGICIGTSGPAGTDMITGLYSAAADTIPILCITGQAPRSRLHKEDFQAVDIAAIAKPVAKWAVTVMGTGAGAPALPAGLPSDALRPARSGADRSALRRADDRDRIRSGNLRALAGLPSQRRHVGKSTRRWPCSLRRSAPLIVAGGGIINADA